MRTFAVLSLLVGCGPDAPRAEDAAPAAVAPAGVDGLWVLSIRRQQWKPRDLEFVARLERDGDRVTGAATLDPVFSGRTVADVTDVVAGDGTVSFTLRSHMDGVVYRFAASLEGGAMDGLVTWNDQTRDQTEPFTAYRRDVRRFDEGIAQGRFPVELDPWPLGGEPVLVDRLVLGAETARSDALVVLADGKLVASRTFGGADGPESVDGLSAAVTALADGAADVPNGLHLRPSELAALGQAILDGAWTGAPVVPSGWLARILAHPTDDESAWTVLPDPQDSALPPIGYGVTTPRGEALLLFPEARLVVVRTLHRAPNPYDARYDARDRMEWLGSMSEAIALDKVGRAPLVVP